MHKLNYLWRVLATGWCFFSFSIGGLLLALTVLPLLRLFTQDEDRCRDRIQFVIHRAFRLFIGQMCRLGVMSVELHDADKLRDAGGVLVMANHPTLIDVVLMISLMPRADCIVKEKLWRHPGFGGVIRSAGYIPNTGPEALVAACRRQLNIGRPVIVFPEGTRTAPGGSMLFQRGAAHVALAARCGMLPVLLTCEPSSLTKDKRWYQIPERRFHVRLQVKSPIDCSDFELAQNDLPLAARQLTRALQQYFSRELSEHANT